MALYKTTEGYRYEFQKNGKRYTRSGFRTKSEARAAREEHIKEISKNLNITQIDITFSEIAAIYLDYAEKAFVKNTYRQKAHVFRSFIKHMGNLQVKQITAHHLFQYLNTRPTNNNYNAHRRELCALLSYARDVLEVLEKSPCDKLSKLPHSPALKKIPTEQEILQLITAANSDNGERDLILTLIYSMARVDEILRLRWEDINFEKSTLTKWTRKRKGGSYESVEIAMNQELMEIMKKKWADRKNQIWVFYNEQTNTRYFHRPKLMKGLCKKAGIKHFGFHGLRHFVASMLADSGKVSKKTIGALLGHKELKTTEIYLHSIESSEREAVHYLSGKFGT